MEGFVSIQLDRKSDRPLYIQIFEAIEKSIISGKLPPREKLPAIRKMATFLGVNSVTVVNAYKMLEEEGLVISKVGSGTYISPSAIFKKPSLKESGEYDANLLQKDNVLYDFASSAVSPDFFPVKDFQRVLNEVLERDKGYAFGYQESLGYLPLRKSIQKFIFDEYTIKTTTKDIQIVSGAQQGIDIIAKAFVDFKDTVFVEAPTYPGAVNAFKSRGAKIVEIPMENDGVNMKELKKRLKSDMPKLFYTMPNFQNPSGISYSEEKKKELLALSQAHDFIILEDDHVNDLYYDKKAVPLKALDNDGRVVYIKSFSKLFMPGIRLAFMVFPKGFSEKIAYAKYSSDIFSSGLFQRAMDLYFRKSLWQNHIEDIRTTFRQRWQSMVSYLEKYLPDKLSYHIPKGGLHFWILLPKGYYAMNLYNSALEKGLLLIPGDVFYASQKPCRYFRLSLANIDPNTMEQGVIYLAEIIQEFLRDFPINPATDLGYRPVL